jgi:hypothetical protein
LDVDGYLTAILDAGGCDIRVSSDSWTLAMSASWSKALVAAEPLSLSGLELPPKAADGARLLLQGQRVTD